MTMDLPPSKPPFIFKTGALLLVDKPKGWTSFDVVNKLRYKIKFKLGVKKFKIGHSGTLDPLATGLLILCTGKFTKKLTNLQGLDKGYTGTIKLGATTPSYDAETEEDAHFPIDHLTEETVVTAIEQFKGPIEQFPPIFSAIKVDGKPLYKSARAGIKVEVKPRSVHIYEYDLLSINLPSLDFYVKCSKGTYIRSLAHDLGKALDNGAYLTNLRRTSIGPYTIEDAWNLEELLEFIDKMELPKEEDQN